MGLGFRLFCLVSYFGFRLCEGIVRLFPLEGAFLLGRVGGALAYCFLWRRRNLALRNLRLAFGGEMSEARLHALNREHFQLLGANLLSSFKASGMSDEKIWERISAEVPAERGQIGWVALISHIGNWELFSHLGARFPEYRFSALYQGLANPYIDRYLRRTRTGSGNILFDRRTEILKCVRFLREGGVVGVLIDQGAGYAGLWTPLFRRLTSSSTLAALLSIRTGRPVVPIAINTSGRARWKMTISDPVYPEDDDAELFTARINRMLEAQIRRAPADWLWSHNRWKPLRPHVLFARDQRRVLFPPDFDRATLDPFRILIVSPDTTREVIASIPAVRAIKQGRPDIWLAVLASAPVASIWRDIPEVDTSIEWRQSAASPFQLASRISARALFDVAIFFEPRWKTALAVRLARIPLRIGRRHGLLSVLYNQHPVPASKNSDSTASYLQLAHSVGANIEAHHHAAS